jgi:hypothetical protein
VVSQDALVPPHVRHEHIHMPLAQRLACLCNLLRTELGTCTATTSQNVAVSPSDASGSVCDALEVKEPNQAIVFMDDVTSVESVRAAIETALAAQEHAPDAIISGTQRSVGVLLDSMSLEARAKAVQEYRCAQGRLGCWAMHVC